MEQETYNKVLPDATWAYSYGQCGLYSSVVFLWVEGGVRIMTARDSLLVLYITVTLLVVTLQKKITKMGQPQQNSNKKKYYRFDRVCLCKYVCRGGGGRNGGILLSPVCIPLLCYKLWSFKCTVEVIAGSCSHYTILELHKNVLDIEIKFPNTFPDTQKPQRPTHTRTNKSGNVLCV
jgi:hypothetical protein